jgi:hypothetical protein
MYNLQIDTPILHGADSPRRTMMRYIPGRLAAAVLALLLAAFTGSASADPPSRVMRLSNLSGAVSFAAGGSDEWLFAPINRPVVNGDRLWADADGRAEIQMGNGTAWIGPQTSVRVLNLDDDVVQLEVSQGTMVLRVRRLDSNDSVEIDTPNLAFVVTRPGSYRVAVDDRGDATLVAVRDGAAEVYGGRASYVVTRNQTYRFYGTDLADSEVLPSPPFDALERYAADRGRSVDRGVSARYVSTEVIGYADLDTYGSWTAVPEYGNVWFPRAVATDWAPYRYGHWSWIDPWGWTWVDDAPWGFAPFHYGRWAHVSRGWCWVPGPANVRPVYAPALVAFVGGGNVSLSLSTGPAIGWFPLAPREVYRPWYNATPNYVRQVNVTNTTITNVTVINNVVNNTTTVTQANQYVNLRAPNGVTAVPPAAMAQSQSVQRVAVRVQPNAIDRSHVTPTVQVVPAQQALVGATKPGQAKPPASAETRSVVARAAPPPPPMSVAERLPMLQKDPKPIDRPRAQAAAPAAAPGASQAGAAAPGAAPQAAAPGRPGAPAAPAATASRGAEPPANVRVVQASKPAANAAPPAKAPDANRAAGQRPEQRAAPSAAPPGASAVAPSGAPGGQPPAATPPVAQPPAAAPPVAQPPASQPARPATAAQPPREETRAAQPSRDEPRAPAPPGQAEETRRLTPPGQPPRNGEARPAGPAATQPARAPEAPVTPPQPVARPAPAQPEAARPTAPVPPQPEAARREAPRPPEALAPRGAPMERSAPEAARAAPPPPSAPQAAPARPPEVQRAAPPARPPEVQRAAPPPPPQASPPRAPEAARAAPVPAETRQAASPARAAPPEQKAAPAPPPAQRAPEQRGSQGDKGKEREKEKDKKDGGQG